MHNLLLFAAEAGHEGNGAILPHDINEVIWGSIAFFIVAGLIIWKGGPAIKNMWNGRIDRLRKELDDAAGARAEAESKLGTVEQRIAHADQERARIRAEADQTAGSLKSQIAERAQHEAEEIRQRAVTDAENVEGPGRRRSARPSWRGSRWAPPNRWSRRTWTLRRSVS